MRRWMRSHGLPSPIFQEVGQTFKVTFTGPGESILDLIPEEGVTDLHALGLKERQVEALRLMVNEGKGLTNSLYQRLFGVSPRTAVRDLRGLVSTGWVQPLGERKGTTYTAR